MKALWLDINHELTVKETLTPIPHNNEVLVKVQACGICKTDVDMLRNKTGAGKVSLPIIPGHEFSGIVEDVGHSVVGVQRGDRVSIDPLCGCGQCKYCLEGMPQFCKNRIVYGTNINGGMAEYCAVNYRQVHIMDNLLSFEEATLAEPLGCCLHAIEKVIFNLNKIDQVVIIGGGTLGSLLLQVLLNRGVKKVVVVEPNRHKREKAIRIGATAAVDGFKELIMALDANHMDWLDIVFDCVGSSNTIKAACEIVRKCGEVILLGIPDLTVGSPISYFDIFRKEINITGSCLNPSCHADALSLLSSGIIDTEFVIDCKIPFHDIISVLYNYEAYDGKIVISF